jgi:biopolymer transport protein ExbD
MEFISFDLSKVILAILIFFKGCTAFEPPTPVTITTPKTVVTEEGKKFYSNSLLIDMSNSEKLIMTYTDQDQNKKRIESNMNDESKLQEKIQQVIDWSGNGQKLTVLIREDHKASCPGFQTVIKALAAKGLYKYKLITTPE